MNPLHEPLPALALFAAVGSGLIGGLLFAFSNFVMAALRQQPPECGIRAMRAINLTILNPLFLLIFLGTAAASAGLAAAALFSRATPPSPVLLTGCALYLAGTFGLTICLHVPLNNKLADQDAATEQGAQYWTEYVAVWARWNHVRTAAALAAAVCFILALRGGAVPSPAHP